MFKNIILIGLVIFCTGCSMVSSTNPYNIPFINSDETIQLQQGMKKQDVLSKIGDPLYVESGVNNTIIWIYEVRSTEVLSDTDIITNKIIVNKTNANTRHSSPIHQLKIVFVNNKVEQWNMVSQKEKIAPEINTPTEEEDESPKTETEQKKKKNPKRKIPPIDKQSNLVWSPSIWVGSTIYDMGSGWGVSATKGNLGVEIKFNSAKQVRKEDWDWGRTDATITTNYNSFNWLLLYEKNFNMFTTRVGGGMTYTHADRKVETDWESYEYDLTDTPRKELFMRASIGKHFSYKRINFTPMLEMNYFNEDIGFSLMTRFDFGR